MKQKIAVNSKHTGDRKKDHRGYAETWTSERLDGLLAEDWLRQMVADIRGGHKELKDKLPYICPHYSAFRNNHRAQADIIPEAFTFITCVDVDDADKVEKAIARSLELNSEEGGDWEDQVLRIAYSARKKVHIYIRMPMGMTIEEAQRAFCAELEDVPFDASCITPERYIYLTGADEEVYRSEHWLDAIPDEELDERREAFLMRGLDVDGRVLKKGNPVQDEGKPVQDEGKPVQGEVKSIKPDSSAAEQPTAASLAAFDLCAQQAGLSADEMDVWGVHNWHANLMAVLSVGVAKLMSRKQLQAVVGQRLPNYSQTEDCQKLIDYFYEKYEAGKGFMNPTLREINARAQQLGDEDDESDDDDDDDNILSKPATLTGKKLPQGVSDSVAAVGPALTMPVVTAICPCIGALATGVRLDVHGKKRGLNLIAYIAGEFASGKGQMDEVVEAWMSELRALDDMYLQQEADWVNKKKAAKNKKEQPEEPKLPIRLVPLNNTVAQVAERLANVEGKHAFSFTPEADTIAQKFKSTMTDFSIMLRQSYDGSRYDREARSTDSVRVHINHLLWNVTMCGTPDALYRVVSNYTDGFQSRIAVASTPDNTYMPLEDKEYVLTPRQAEHIHQIAHLLPLMQGTVVLPKLEAKGRAWLERIRMESMMNDDRVKARQRLRICVTTQRMVCCLMLCKVCERLIQKHGLKGAEDQLKQHPDLWKEMLLKTQTPAQLDTFDALADMLMDNALYYFRDRIERAYNSREYAGGKIGGRKKRGKNDSIFDRLDQLFTYEQARQQSVAVKGADVTQNSVTQMLKNWRKQGLVELTEDGKYRKTV